MTKAQASKAAEGQGCNRRDSDAGRCSSPACAKQAVHETANVRGLDRAACSASNTGLDGCWHCLPGMLFSPRSSGSRPSRGCGKRAAEAHASGKQERTLHCAPYPIAAACPTAHQGTKPQKEACLIHGRHARRAPAPDVLIERRCRVQRLRASLNIQQTLHITYLTCKPMLANNTTPSCTQPEQQHKAERGRARAVCRECSPAAKPHAPSRISRLYERQASKAAEEAG